MVVGLTGGIGTGKSTVLKLFTEKGAETLSADNIAKEIVEKNEPAYLEIVKYFGESILDSNKEIDRKALANIVFSDTKARKKLEEITHPKIMKRMMDAAECYKKGKEYSSKIIVLEIPLLYECEFDNHVDKVIVVTSEQETSIGRLTKERGLSVEDANARINSQMPIKCKVEKADFVIYNDGRLSELKSAVDFIWGELLKISG